MGEPNTQEQKATNEHAATENNSNSTHGSNANTSESSGKLEKIIAFMAFGLGAIAVNAVLPKKFKLESDDLADLISKFSLMDFCNKESDNPSGESIFEEIEKRAQNKKNKL